MKNEDVFIQIVPHRNQPFKNTGDWHEHKDGSTLIRVSDMDNWLYHRLHAIHELIEDTLRRAKGISEEEVNEFCKICDPIIGSDDPKSPIYHEHRISTICEQIVCEAAGIKWHFMMLMLKNS